MRVGKIIGLKCWSIYYISDGEYLIFYTKAAGNLIIILTLFSFDYYNYS
jgi:hypothetical protein